MSDDEIKRTIDSISSPLNETFKKLQDDLNPLKNIASQFDKFRTQEITNIYQPEYPKIEIPVNPNLASEFHKRLIKWIQDFDEELDQEYEVGVRLVTFGQTVTFHLEEIGYWDPSLISFSGVNETGDPVELIQHVSQISILLLKMKRKDPEKPKRPIGFAAWDEEPTE